MRTVTIPVREYRDLLKDATRVDIIRRIASAGRTYIDREELVNVIGLFTEPAEPEKDEEGDGF